MNERLRFLVTESSIRTSRIFLTKVENSVVFAETSKMKILGTHHWCINRCQIEFNPKPDFVSLWILKCDVKKFFASIDQIILIKVLSKYIQDIEVMNLLQVIIQSFHSTAVGKGLPLGNLTSQLLVNVYMNEFDQYVKHVLKVKYYIRYADDFVIIHNDRSYLENVLKKIDAFLSQELRLQLHPNKVFIETLASGVDFLGWVHFPKHRVFRTATKRRMFVNPKADPRPQVIDSYLGMLSHGNAKDLQAQIEAFKSVDN